MNCCNLSKNLNKTLSTASFCSTVRIGMTVAFTPHRVSLGIKSVISTGCLEHCPVHSKARCSQRLLSEFIDCMMLIFFCTFYCF